MVYLKPKIFLTMKTIRNLLIDCADLVDSFYRYAQTSFSYPPHSDWKRTVDGIIYFNYHSYRQNVM